VAQQPAPSTSNASTSYARAGTPLTPMTKPIPNPAPSTPAPPALAIPLSTPPLATTSTITDQLLHSVLQQMQIIHHKANESNTNTITMDKSLFEAMANAILQAYEASSVAKNPTIIDSLAQIQTSIANLEKRYNDIEVKITDIPKTYAEAAKPNTKLEQQMEIRKRREALRQERIKYGVTLTLKNMSEVTQKSTLALSAKTIAERCQQAIN
jgi:hypothetical protein